MNVNNRLFFRDFFNPVYVISLVILMAAVFYVSFSELRIRGAGAARSYEVSDFNEGWQQIYADGEAAVVKIPGRLRPSDGLVRIDNVIPDSVVSGYYAAVRADWQAVDIYINDILRKSYAGNDRRYVFVELRPEDSGGSISIRLRNRSVTGTAPVYDILYGEGAGIWYRISQSSAFMISLAVVAFAASSLLFLAVLYLSFRDRRLNELIFLSITGMGFGMWGILSNVMVQFLPVSTVAAFDASFYVACFMQAPLTVYVDRVNEHRFSVYLETVFQIYMGIGILLSLLNLTGIASFTLTWPVVVAVQFIAGLSLLVTFRIDMKRGGEQSFRIIYLGVLANGVGNTLELLRVLFFPLRNLAGISSLGIIALIIFAVLNTLVGYSRTRSERDAAVRLKELRSSFLAAMSHEIRTPINSIIGLNDAILQEEKDEKILINSRMVRDSSRELLLLVNDILDISRIEAGRFKPVPIPMRLSESISSVKEACSDRAGAAGLDIDISGVSDDGRLVEGDAKRIESVLQNLVTFFTAGSRGSQPHGAGKTRGDIIISAYSDERETHISVTCASVRIKNGGVLGKRDIYSYSAAVILGCLGSELEEQLSDGMTDGFSFALTLPPAAVRGEEGSSGQEDPGGQGLSGIRVLAVDDQDVNRLMFKRMIEKAGALVKTASSGREAVEMVTSEDFDIILMDVRMPEMSGPEAMKAVRMIKELPVVAFTADNDPVEHEKLLKQGFDSVLTKPVEPEELYSAIRKSCGGVR